MGDGVSPRMGMTELDDDYQEEFDDLEWAMGPRVEVGGNEEAN